MLQQLRLLCLNWSCSRKLLSRSQAWMPLEEIANLLQRDIAIVLELKML